ncbi:MAG: hypothetical protein A2V69_00525 [Candidatus Portnoybacteria bacterium RBG_13_40_8]|uniref:J domain-containing protein n=1 Tax=Candidatus Portnoybacteria bacterium RBG_13_40_8 TaxID=1801990 RepID=A0A1G2F1F6_9BACT|nr:MAG: hypothetical protein A2V69_00525 [Candidatus Portnoybacteria bacterium RBG_13_40_8]
MFKFISKKNKKRKTGQNKKYLIIIAILVAILVIAGATAGYFVFRRDQKPEEVQIEKNIYEEFLSEIYDKIQENYWNKISDEELATLFRLGLEKLTNAPQSLKSNDKSGMIETTNKIIDKLEENKKKDFTAQLAHLVLWNLKPFGRSALYVKKDEENLKNRVMNINPQENLYSVLGVEDNANQEKLNEAYRNKVNELDNQETEEAKQELEKVKYAYEVLSNAENKKRYDETKTEPTVFGKLIRPTILHLYISKISPTILEDLKRETEKFDNTGGLNTLILDLRANVGGSLDILPYLLGPFIGPNNYAFELFQQANYEPFKTKLGWLPSLVRYKKVVILADEKTQSSAEVMVASLKKYNVGVFVGTKTKGWGTIEKVYEIDHQIDESEKYSIFLVNHLTLRDDNQPIEEAGVEPVIDINDPEWENKLFEYFNSNELVKAVKEAWNSSPGKI